MAESDGGGQGWNIKPHLTYQLGWPPTEVAPEHDTFSFKTGAAPGKLE